MGNTARSVFYDESHTDIVRTGIEAISNVLNRTDSAEKESLLLCLDRYLDPWFGYKLSYEKELFELLQYVVVSPNAVQVKMDALALLTNYSWPPFAVIEDNLDKIESDLRGWVEYAIYMDDDATA